MSVDTVNSLEDLEKDFVPIIFSPNSTSVCGWMSLADESRNGLPEPCVFLAFLSARVLHR